MNFFETAAEVHRGQIAFKTLYFKKGNFEVNFISNVDSHS